MGIYTREAPLMGCRPLDPPVVHCDPVPLALEQRMRRHAFDEARREVDSWLTGRPYEWRSFGECERLERLTYCDLGAVSYQGGLLAGPVGGVYEQRGANCR